MKLLLVRDPRVAGQLLAVLAVLVRTAQSSSWFRVGSSPLSILKIVRFERHIAVLYSQLASCRDKFRGRVQFHIGTFYLLPDERVDLDGGEGGGQLASLVTRHPGRSI